jgi:uncharacterized protein (TIGR03000 family)
LESGATNANGSPREECFFARDMKLSHTQDLQEVSKMYSVVMMMALTTGGETPDCHRGGGGCSGVAVSSCGCHGGGHLFGGRHGGCNGGGCYGGGYACYGGGYGGCYGGGYACYGGGYGGCWGSGGCYGGAPVGMPGGEKIKPPMDKKDGDKKDGDKKDGTVGSIGAPARITVSMPGDARFTIDSYVSPAKSDTHVIVSAPLGAEESKTYVLKAEVYRDGKLQTIQEQVTVRSGDNVKVTLTLPTSVAAR